MKRATYTGFVGTAGGESVLLVAGELFEDADEFVVSRPDLFEDAPPAKAKRPAKATPPATPETPPADPPATVDPSANKTAA